MADMVSAYTLRRVLLACTVIPVLSLSLPADSNGYLPLFAGAAYADDDDGGGDDGGDDDGGGGGRSGNDGNNRGGGNNRSGPAFGGGNLIQKLFGTQPRAQRPARAVRVATRAPSQIIAIGLSNDNLDRLTQAGFTVAERLDMQLMPGQLVRLATPRGMTLQAARDAVQNEAPQAVADFNHYYAPESADRRDCEGDECAMVRDVVGWPEASTGSCQPPVRIGLVDTAINASHDALAMADLEIVRLHRDDVSAQESGRQHGTAVAALLVGRADSRTPGLLPQGSLLAVDAFRNGKSGDRAEAFDLIRALDALSARGVKVVNLSLSGPANALLEKAVQAADQNGIILIAAAGNEGPNSKPVYPAGYENVVAVTAVDRAHNPYRRAVRGNHIDIAAPGVGVWTAASVSGARSKNGTSYAAPFVTAAAALLKAGRPELKPDEIRALLTDNADDLGRPGRDDIFGWGLLDARQLCVASAEQ